MFLFFIAKNAAIKTKNVVPFKQAFNKGKKEKRVVSVFGKRYKVATAIGITKERKMISALYGLLDFIKLYLSEWKIKRKLSINTKAT